MNVNFLVGTVQYLSYHAEAAEMLPPSQKTRSALHVPCEHRPRQANQPQMKSLSPPPPPGHQLQLSPPSSRLLSSSSAPSQPPQDRFPTPARHPHASALRPCPVFSISARAPVSLLVASAQTLMPSPLSPPPRFREPLRSCFPNSPLTFPLDLRKAPLFLAPPSPQTWRHSHRGAWLPSWELWLPSRFCSFRPWRHRGRVSLRATRMRIATPTMLGDLTTALATATTRAMATTASIQRGVWSYTY